MEFSNKRGEVVVVGLFGRSVVFADCEYHSVDGNFAVHKPSEFAAMTESPISCNQIDKEEWCSESPEFTSC